MTTRSVLIVDDEPNMRWVLGKALEQAGYDAHAAGGGDEALATLARVPVDLVLLDLKLRGEDGLTVLRRLRERRPDLVVMLLTAHGTVATAVEAMQLGAADFLRKPFDVEEITFKVARALERRAMQQEIARLAAAHHSAPVFDALVGMSPAWQRLVAQARLVAQSDAHAVVGGPAGSGRTTLARAVHRAGPRSAAPLVIFDAQVYRPDGRAVALLGDSGSGGAWAAAGSGALLVAGLDDDAVLAAALADALAARRPGHGPRLLVIARDDGGLPEELRAQLPLRLDVPPLRERVGDVPLLARHFAGERAFAPEALQALQGYPWPEEVAELRAVVAAAAALAGEGPIGAEHLPAALTAPAGTAMRAPFELPPEGVSLEAVEQELIRQALARARGNKSRAAELLGLTRHTLLYRMEKYGIALSD